MVVIHSDGESRQRHTVIFVSIQLGKFPQGKLPKSAYLVSSIHTTPLPDLFL